MVAVVGLAQLPDDLPFADHQAVQRAGHFEEMADGVGAVQQAQLAGNIPQIRNGPLRVQRRPNPFAQVVRHRRLAVKKKSHPVAGSQIQQFGPAEAVLQVLQNCGGFPGGQNRPADGFQRGVAVREGQDVVTV